MFVVICLTLAEVYENAARRINQFNQSSIEANIDAYT